MKWLSYRAARQGDRKPAASDRVVQGENECGIAGTLGNNRMPRAAVLGRFAGEFILVSEKPAAHGEIH
jgi:hypothetical protein